MTYHTSLPTSSSSPVKDASSTVKEASSNGTTPVNLSYNTISCPCSSYAIDLGNGQIGCERDYYGVVKSVKPVAIKNHFIENKSPKIGDRWLCTNLKCEQDDFKWDTFHVVAVEEEDNLLKNSSLFNSKKSTLNCYKPNAGINKFDDKSNEINREEIFGTVIATVNGIPVYDNENSALAYSSASQKTGITKYDKDGLSGYLPGRSPDEKLITGVFVNNLDILDNIGPTFKALGADEHAEGKMLFKASGDVFKFKIRGVNNPMFTLSLKDSSGCDIVTDKHVNVPIKGTYSFNQIIPPLPSGATSEIYDLKIVSTADTKYLFHFGGQSDVYTGIINMKIYQYKNPAYTLAVTSSLSGVSHANKGPDDGTGDYIFSGNVGTSVSNKAFSYVSVLSHATKNLYFKNPLPSFDDLIAKSNVIKKTVIREDFADNSEINEILVRTKPEVDANDNAIYQGDIKKGMKFSSSVTKTKTIRESIDLDIHKEPCDNCPERDILTNKFEIDNTSDIFEGMTVYGITSTGGGFTTTLESIDCSKSITLQNSYTINKNTILNFSYSANGTVYEVKEAGTGQLLRLSSSVKLPSGTEIVFENGNSSSITGYIKHSGSGGRAKMTITTVINKIKYGQEDATFTLNVDDFVSHKPNDGDQHLVIGKNSAILIDFMKNSVDLDKYNRTLVITKQPSNGVLGSLVGKTSTTFHTNTNFTGKDKISFTSSDTTKDDAMGDEKSIFITVK